MLKKIRSLLRWLWWNSANMLSIIGFIGAYLFLFYFDLSVTGKLAGYIAMEIIDMIDGPFARWLDNADGIGKVIDPIADKGKKFLVLYFLFLDPVLVSWAIIGLLSLGEIAVFILIGDAVCMAFKFEYLYLQAELKFKWWPGWMNCVEIYKNAKKEIFKNWHVVQDGKITMVYYAVMFGVIFLRSIWMTMGVFVALYWILAIIGFCLRLSSYLDYRKKFLDWQNKASARATQGRLI